MGFELGKGGLSLQLITQHSKVIAILPSPSVPIVSIRAIRDQRRRTSLPDGEYTVRLDRDPPAADGALDRLVRVVVEQGLGSLASGPVAVGDAIPVRYGISAGAIHRAACHRRAAGLRGMTEPLPAFEAPARAHASPSMFLIGLVARVIRVPPLFTQAYIPSSTDCSTKSPWKITSTR